MRKMRDMHGVLTAVVVVAVAAVLLSFGTEPAVGQFNYDVEICKKIEARGHVYGSELVTRQCGNRFTAGDPYVAIVLHLRNFSDSMDVSMEVLDPDQRAVWSRVYPVRVAAGWMYSDYWVWGVLPIAADDAALAADNPRLVAAKIMVEGRPVKERLGDWTVRIRIDKGWPLTRKFTLVAAP